MKVLPNPLVVLFHILLKIIQLRAKSYVSGAMLAKNGNVLLLKLALKTILHVSPCVPHKLGRMPQV